jgi:hypothetical protein
MARRIIFFVTIFICANLASLAALEFAVSDTGFEMTAAWRQESAVKGFGLQADADKINIFWGYQNSDMLKIMPAEHGVHFEYKINVEAADDTQADSGIIKMSLNRSRDYHALDYLVGFYYDYHDYLHTGIETSGEVIDGSMRFSVRPIVTLELGAIGRINSGFDIGALIAGNTFNALYIDICFKWQQ